MAKKGASLLFLPDSGNRNENGFVSLIQIQIISSNNGVKNKTKDRP